MQGFLLVLLLGVLHTTLARGGHASPPQRGADISARYQTPTKSCGTQFPTPQVQTSLTLTWELGNPDGHARNLIKVNGTMPGPDLIFDEGDQVEITVLSDMPFNATVHWHGLLMRNSQWSDGVPGLTQKPIEPGQSFIYRFTAEPAGTYWYHSHSRMTMLDGLYGALYIRPKPETPTPFALISSDARDVQQMWRASRNPTLVTLSDWSNWTSWEYMDIFEQTQAASFCTDSILVNGQGSQYCPGHDFLIANTRTDLASFMFPQVVTDKGCIPFVKADEGYFLPYVEPQNLPAHYQEGCLPATQPNATIEVDPAAGWASLNFVMASSNKWITVSVDEHDMWIYEVDGQFIVPQKIQAMTLYPGERYAALIKLDKEPKDYVIHVPDNGLSQVQPGYAIMSYKGGAGWQGDTVSWLTWNGNSSSPATTWLNDTFMPPYPANPPPPAADQTVFIKLARSGQPYLWSMSKNGQALYHQDNTAYTPLLYNLTGTLGEGLDPDLLIMTKNNTVVDLVLEVGWREDEIQEIQHLLHKHASKMWIIGVGTGIFEWPDVATAVQAAPEFFNMENPIYRDTAITSAFGTSFVVMRYHVNVPGAWFLHCHIEMHLGGGMGMAILDGVDAWPVVPPEYGIWQMGHPLVGNESYAPHVVEQNDTRYESDEWVQFQNLTWNEDIKTVSP